jgi:3-hydroxyisobutyrate dehydrogenase-like beta-hydroxyacid dehydrogenase
MTLAPVRDPGSSLAIAVLGLGEAGSLIARDLIAAGAVLRGYDPKAATGEVIVPDGAVAADSEATAVAGSGLVLSVNSAKAAVQAFEAAIPALRPGAIWADLNTASRASNSSSPRSASGTASPSPTSP